MRSLTALLFLAACGADGPRGTADEVPIAIAPAPGVYPFQGTWAADPSACDVGFADGRTDLTVITTQTVLHEGRSCDVVSVSEAYREPGMAGRFYGITLDCPDGNDDPFAVSTSGDTLTVFDGAARTELRRCEPMEAGE